MDQVLLALQSSAGMLWKALWALVFGYMISAAVQVLVTRKQMGEALGDRGVRPLGLAVFFGFVSSSCSFAALATSRSVLVKGAHPANALAPALVGIAMGSGTDVAMEIAGVTLVKGDLRAIARARCLSRATMRNIRQNLFLAFVYNLASVPVAAGVLYPFTAILINPIWASAAMTLSPLSVVGNALGLRQVKL